MNAIYGQTWVHYIHHAIVINGLGIKPIMF